MLQWAEKITARKSGNNINSCLTNHDDIHKTKYNNMYDKFITKPNGISAVTNNTELAIHTHNLDVALFIVW
jgi:hypothetical protein